MTCCLCDKEAYARGYCSACYYRLKRRGELSNLTTEDRFWRYVEHGLDPEACWPWKGYLDKDGYGYMKYEGTNTAAYRVSLFLTTGTLPVLPTLHRCTNRTCVNPAHLYEGTHQDNADDREKDGNTSKGENHYMAKMTADDVRRIRELMSKGIRGTGAQLGREYGVTRTCIHFIAQRRTWKHVL